MAAGTVPFVTPGCRGSREVCAEVYEIVWPLTYAPSVVKKVAALALGGVRDSVHDQTRSCVEQDKMSAEEPILDVVREPR